MSVVSDSIKGYCAGVDSQGNLQTKVQGTVEVAGSVETTPVVPTLDTGNRGTTIGTSSEELAPATEGRIAMYIANDGANMVCIHFGSDPATSSDFHLAPGEKMSFPVVGEEAVQAIAIGGDSAVSVIQWKVL